MAAKFFGDFVTEVVSVLHGPAANTAGPTKHGSFMKQASTQWRCQVGGHGVCTCALPCDGDTMWISSEGGDVALNPLQSKTLVLQGEISLQTIRRSEKSQDAKPII
jgi:hypothetical protein